MLPAHLRSSLLLRDTFVGALVAVAAQVELLLSADRVPGPLLPHQLVSLLLVPAFALRRVAPLSSILVTAGGFALEPLLGPAPVASPFLALLVLLVSLGWYADRRRGLLGTCAVLVAGLTFDLSNDDFVLADVVVNTVIIVAAWASGHLVRRTTDRRVAAEIAAREAVTAERERISRDLHDSVAHALTLITLQAGGAREQLGDGPVSQVLTTIERTGREALADMHRFLGLLGRPEEEAPGVADLPDLVDRVVASGLRVQLDVEPVQLPASISTTVYRVVQEALTNVVRHSDARNARVLVGVEPSQDAVVVRITDDGSPIPVRLSGSGRGISGLRRRLALFDGVLQAAATPEGWRLEARIPLEASPPRPEPAPSGRRTRR